MPFKSKKQIKYLLLNHPEVYKRIRQESPKQNLSKLPLRVRKKKTAKKKKK